jgi:hypothetical protein
MDVYHESQVPWPADRPVCKDRKSGPFRTAMADATRRIETEVGAFTRAGKPWRTKELWIYADADTGARNRFLNNSRGVRDPRVAVSFDLDGKEYKIVADRYIEPWQNLAGIAEYIKAIRAQERNGIFTAEEMMATFAALPAGSQWFDGCKTKAAVLDKYRELAKTHHPDVGGDQSQMASINDARDRALEAISK